MGNIRTVTLVGMNDFINVWRSMRSIRPASLTVLDDAKGRWFSIAAVND